MTTIAENIEILALNKKQIRDAIIAKGVAVPENTLFRDYPDKIMQITGGGGGGGDTDYIEIAGIKWAKSSLIADPADSTGMTSMFADRQDMYTSFFQWGRKKAWPATGTVTGWDSTTYAGNAWIDDPSPAGWRVPTIAELQALVNTGSTRRAANSSAGNAVAGRFFGPNSAEATMADMKGCIFLAAAGFRNNGSGALDGVGYYSYYWSSSASGASNACCLYFVSDGVFPDSSSYRTWGFLVRCVKAE